MGRAGQDENNGLGSTKTPEEVKLEDRFYDLDFSVKKSRRYHERLCAFYSGWRDWVKIVTVFSGSGLFLLILGDMTHTAAFLAALVTLWAVIDYLVAPDKMAEKHCDLRDRFIDLAINLGKAPRTEQAYAEMSTARLELERDEPPCKRLIDLQARNDECRAQDYPPEDLVPLSRFQRIVGYFVTVGMPRLERWKAERQRQQHAEVHG